MRLVRSLAVWAIVSVVFIGGCAAPTERLDPAQGRKLLDQALDVPQDRGLIAVYAPALSSGGEFLNSQKERSIKLVAPGLFAAIVNEKFYRSYLDSSQQPFFYTLLPGNYRLTATLNQPKFRGSSEIVTTRQTVEIEVKAGDRRLYKWTDYEEPLLEPISVAAARNDEALFTQKAQTIRLDEQQWNNLNARLLKPLESNIPPGSECLPDSLKLRWANARFEGKVRDCRELRQGTFTYDDGHRFSTRFPDGDWGKIGALVSITEGQHYRLRPIAHQPLHKAMEAASPRVGYQELGAINSGNLVAVDKAKLAQVKPDLPLLIDMLTGKPGSKVTLTFESRALGSKADLVVTRAKPEYGSRLSMQPGIDSQIRYPDGRRYTGPVVLDSAKGNQLPLARPRNSASNNLKELNLHGQIVHADGRGFIGQFDQGQPRGQGYCFKGTRGEPCFYAPDSNGKVTSLAYSGNEELKRPAYSTRPASAILADFNNLPKSAAIDLLRKRWVDALLAEKWDAYLIHMAELQTLGFDTGVESIFYEAKALQATRWPELAYDKLQSYLNLAGAGGANYAEALDLYTRLEGPARESRQMRLAKIDEAREKRRGFCQRMIEEHNTLLCGCREFRGQLKGADARQCKS